ncbi:GntR family transcriptional regulator [Pseudonocardia sp.]|uniref:GntR family transcriptional regulator n=1 Tax=Pseudonocardia sp. TaxID=60912 RepID=UPI003D11FF39
MDWGQLGASGAQNGDAGGSAPKPDSALSELPPRDPTALVRTVRERLRLAIVRMEIPEGTRLNQVQVAKQLGVSRMPVRAAITDLLAEGLLEPIGSGGVAVRTLSERDMRDVYEVRMALESQAVRHVAERRSATGLARVERVLADHRSRVADYDASQLLVVDREFHTALLDATENPHFRRAIVPLWAVIERAMFGMLGIPEIAARAWNEHEEIAAAVLAGDPDVAERALCRHLAMAADDLAKVMPRRDGLVANS